jgi:acetate kinase
VQVLAHRVRKYLGAYLVELGGQCDALVFSAGMGENSPRLRAAVCDGLSALGIVLDGAANAAVPRGASADIAARGARVRVLVLPTDEELCIARDTAALSGLPCDA